MKSLLRTASLHDTEQDPARLRTRAGLIGTWTIIAARPSAGKPGMLAGEDDPAIAAGLAAGGHASPKSRLA
jgi:hypothetical protein